MSALVNRPVRRRGERLMRRFELAWRRVRNAPRTFEWVGRDDGEPVGELLETGCFRPVSVVREQIPFMINTALTDLVLRDNVRVNGYRLLGTEWRGNLQVALFQPVLVE